MDVLYELWMHCICGFEPDRIFKLNKAVQKMGNSFNSGEMSRRILIENGVPETVAARTENTEYFDEAKEIIDFCGQNDIRIIPEDSDEYPEYLRQIHMPPRLLFARGKRLNLNARPGVAVVGCRKPTELGKSAAERIGASLAKAGIVTVGGMAEGIDSAAHWGALRAGGTTVAVLAGGVDVIYPAVNKRLYGEIVKNGTVISERPPSTSGKSYFYEQRNRIVTGISRGTVVVEGKLKSGTSMTARIALEENRDLFAVPGNPMCWQSSLPNSMIDEGAVIVKSFDVPARYYTENNPELFDNTEQENNIFAYNDSAYGVYGKRNPQIADSTAKIGAAAASPADERVTDEQKILGFLSDRGGTATNEEIAEACGIPQSRLNGKLTIMSLRGQLRQESGNRYVLK